MFLLLIIKSSIVAISINCFIINLMSYSKTIHVGNTRFIFVCRFTYFTFHRFNEKLILVLTVEAIIKTIYLLFLWNTISTYLTLQVAFNPQPPHFILTRICLLVIDWLVQFLWILAVLSDTQTIQFGNYLGVLCIPLWCVCILVARKIIKNYLYL